MLEKQEYLSIMRADTWALAEAARSGMTAMVPTCPGWMVADLVVHTGGVHRAQAHMIATRAQEPSGIARAMFASVPGLLSWLEHSTLFGGQSDAATIPAGVIEWFEEGAATLLDELNVADLDEPVWSWSGDNRVAHYLRMMPIETAVHRWDAQCAHDRATPIDHALALDGIDHTFEVMMPMRRGRAGAPSGNGESYRFALTDESAWWTVRFDGDPVVQREGEEATDVSMIGTASDLFLFLWGRLPADALRITGEKALLDRYFELVPPT